MIVSMVSKSTTVPRRSWPLKVGILLAAAALAACAWAGAIMASRTQRTEELRTASAGVSGQATNYVGMVHRDLLDIDQMLIILRMAREQSPNSFDLDAWRRRLANISQMVDKIFVLDAHGTVVASTRPDLVGRNIADRPLFTAERATESLGPYIGPPVQSHGSGAWLMNVARRVDAPDGTFAGAVVISFDLPALADSISQRSRQSGDMVALVGENGVLPMLVLGTPRSPGGSIAATPLMAAIRSGAASWIGPSPVDGVQRQFAIERVPDSDLHVVVGASVAAVTAGGIAWRNQAYVFAAAITVLLAMMAAGLMLELGASRRREQRLAADRAELARANAELEQARAGADAKSAQLEVTLAGMSDGVSLFNADLRLMQWNERYPDSCGVPREMLRVGLPIEDILRAQAEAGEFGVMADAAAVEAEVARRVASLRVGSRVGVTERSRPNGRTLELRRDALPGGGFVTLYADITPRKQVEEAHRRARAVAEAAAEEKSRFVAVVSHEIRTPLNVTLNALGLLEQTELDPNQRRLTDMALQAGDALRGLLNDILDLSRMEVGRLALRPTEFALRPVLESVLAMFRNQAAQRGVELGLEIGPGVPDRIVTDPGRLRQVLMNLLSNATKFADPGPVMLTAYSEIHGSRTVVRLAVRDCGPAIPEQDRARLFRPFSQLDGRNEGSGAGLGLAICQILTSLLGGRIGCDVTGDGGKEFWITLALTETAAPAEPVAAVVNTARRSLRARILLVEDVPSNQTIIATMLRREGYAVEVAAEGEAAIRSAAARPFDLVFMDVHMPGLNGLEATRRIRTLPGPASTTPIVGLTADVAAEERRRCLDAGMIDVLGKPVARGSMIAMVERHMLGLGMEKKAQGPAMATAGLARVPAQAAATAAQNAASPTELDPARIASLRQDLPSGAFATLLDSCFNELRERLPRLEAMLATGDAAEIAAMSHAMAGAAASYGLQRLAFHLRRIESAARTGEIEAAGAVAEGLAGDFARAEQAILAALLPEAV
jgi:signal transduction histidine kinase/DNA-binding response OmpR family regulator/HPt (histidine-containing phosphotransfer) domain-containing protein